MSETINTVVESHSTPDSDRLNFFELVMARGRFVLLLGFVLGIMAFWPFLTNFWDKLTRPSGRGGAISADTEYWCPMCPGVVSDWATKCPVCNMSLVRRKKGEMTPLPDGVVARVQLSPYRVQYAGIRTATIEFRKLQNEITLAGIVLQDFSETKTPSPMRFFAQVNSRDAAVLKPGQSLVVRSENGSAEALSGQIVSIAPPSNAIGAWSVLVVFDNRRGDIKKGDYVTAKVSDSASLSENIFRQNRERFFERAILGSLRDPMAGPFAGLFEGMVFQVASQKGLVLSIPESAIVDMGSRKIAYVEAMPGMYDAVEVKVGNRTGDFYPLFGGLEYGQSVVVNGAILLDAETRLNPSLAAGYFGASKRNPSVPLKSEAPNGSLSASDEVLAKKQQICPVTGEPLDSMGGPVRVDLEGRTVFVCCKSCEKPLRKSPTEYLSKLPK